MAFHPKKHQADHPGRWCGALLCLTVCAGVASAAQNRPPPAPTLTVVVRGADGGPGPVVCALFDSADSFLRRPRHLITAQPGERGEARCVFTGLTAGEYAVSAFHDANANGQLDRNFLRIPREPVGSSDSTSGRLGPPRYEDSAFTVDGDHAITVILRAVGL